MNFKTTVSLVAPLLQCEDVNILSKTCNILREISDYATSRSSNVITRMFSESGYISNVISLLQSDTLKIRASAIKILCNLMLGSDNPTKAFLVNQQLP